MPASAVRSGGVGANARLRFAVALTVSALIHAVFAASLAPGLGARARAPKPATAAAWMTVDLAAPVAKPATASPEREPEPPPRRQAPRAASEVPPPARVPRAHALKPAAANALADLPDPTYYAARQLDVYPALEAPLELEFPQSAAAANTIGRVLLLVLIEADGVVDTVTVVESEPANLFDEHARRALLAARFKPASRGGRAVKSRLLVHVQYGSREEAAR